MKDVQVDRLTLLGQKLAAFAWTYGPRVIMALLVLWIGSLLIRVLARILDRVLDRRGVEQTLKRFLHSLVTISLRILLFITCIQMVGVETTSFVAIIGAAGLAVGLALQGTLANCAGGTLILLFKPYQVGDLVEAQGITGHVKEIQIFTTVLLTPEGRTAIIPNGAMANGNIINHSSEGRIRVDLTIALGHEVPTARAREVLLAVMRADDRVLADPPPSVSVARLTPDGVDLALRPWCAPGDYWAVHFGTYERVRDALAEAGINWPRKDIHVHHVN